MRDYTTDTKAPWFVWRNGIKRVVIEDGVTILGTHAFREMFMDSVSFGNTVETIREYAFQSCDSLRRLYFPNSLQRIEHECFNGSNHMTLVDFGDSKAVVEYYAFVGNANIKTVRCSKVKEIQWSAFQSCQQLINLQLGDSLTHIGSYAFYDCKALKKLYIPASVSQIDDGAFSTTTALDTIVVDPANQTFNSAGDCNAIMRTNDNFLIAGCRNTIIPTTTKCIYYHAFEGCTGLQTVVLPEGLESIYDYAFDHCANLQSINIPNSVNYVGCDAFNNCSSLTTPLFNDKLFAFMPASYSGAYVMSNTIQTLCCGAFHGCHDVTSVTLPNGLTSIPSMAFCDCFSLSSLVIPDGVTSIGSSAFTGCSSLSSIAIPANLQNMGENVFGGCTSLKHITWNARDAQLSWIFYDPSYSEQFVLEQMSWYHPFYDIRKQIQTFTLGDSVRVIPRYLCYEMENITSLSFGCEVDSIELHAFDGCKRIASVVWNARECKDPVIYTASPLYPFRNNITSMTLGDSVQHIPAYLCHGMSRIKHLHIPKNVSSIGDYAFRYMSALDSISVDTLNVIFDSRNHCNALIETSSKNLMLGCCKTRIPDDVRSIGDGAFRNVRGLRTIVYIGTEAFNGCLDLDTIVLPSTLNALSDYVFQDCSNLDTLALPETLEFIGIRALSNCSGLTNLTLPAATDFIDQNAFYGCSGLEYINCFAETPPTAESTAFRGTTCPIYVPCPSLAQYRKAPVWKDLITEYETPTGISYAPRVIGMFDLTLTTVSNDYYWGRDTIYQQPDCETNAIIFAAPNAGYEFVAWTDTLGKTVSTDQLYEFYVDEDIKLIAVFKEKEDALDNVDARTKVWVNAQEVLVLSDRDSHAALYDMMGRQVDACSTVADIVSSLHAPAAGVYITVIDGHQQKVMVQ